MGLYENVKEAAKMKGYSINKLEQELGFARSYIGKFKTITPSADKIQKIADFLDVSANYLITGENDPQTMRTCHDCGLTYATDYADDVLLHDEMHKNWEMAVNKFGTMYCYSEENERIKSENRNIRDDKNNTIDERYNAELEVLRCLFSRSVKANSYDLRHVSFDAYVAMMMHSKEYRKNLDDELYQKIVDNFGTKPGIKDGESIYHIPTETVELSVSSEPKIQILKYYNKLNPVGKQEAEKRIEELTHIDKYTNTVSVELLNAAHEIPGATEEEKKHDNDIMDDENF